MITRGKLIFLAVMLTLTSLIMITSCQKEIEHGDPPQLPPSDAFLMSLISFPNTDDSLSSKLNSESFENTPSYNNWENAHNAMSQWNPVTDFPLGVTTACYLEALKVDPIYIGNNTFGWSCNFLYLNTLYSARLTCNWIANLEYKIEMYIAKPGLNNGFGRFKWLEGTIRHDWTRGSLLLYESPSNPRRFLRMEWNKNWEKNTGDIKYTNLKQGPIPTGSFIQFFINSEPNLDASFTASKAGKKIVIEWNRANNSGHISDPLKYNDAGEWHCWTKFLQDTDCE